MPTISLCMIARDEERVLAGCLSSVAPWVDELVVVDTGSADRTPEIARRHGAAVFHFPWVDDFSAARNFSLSQASGDWVLWLDADDLLPEASGRGMRRLAEGAGAEVGGFRFWYDLPLPAEQGGGHRRLGRVSLFRNRPEHRFQGRVHEQPDASILAAGGRLVDAGLTILHQNYDYSPEGQARKAALYGRILAQESQERPEDPFVWFNLGMLHFGGAQPDLAAARQAFERFLELADPAKEIAHKGQVLLAETYRRLGELEQAERQLGQALSLYPGSPELLFAASATAQDLGRLEEAAGYLQTILTTNYSALPDGTNLSTVRLWPLHNLGIIRMRQGRWEEAEQHLQAALEANPTAGPTLFALGELYLLTGRRPELELLLVRLAAVDPAAAERLSKKAG